jgi:tetratricopeptide (TPR) repeat protein
MGDESKSAKAESLKEEGIKLFRFGEYEEAASSFSEAHALYVELDNARGQGEMLNNLGAIHTQQGEWEQAVDAFSKSRMVFEALDDTDGLAQTLGNLGTMYRHQGDAEKSVEYLKEAANLFQETGDSEKQASTLRVISRIRLGQARWFEALHFYDLSLTCIEPPGLKERILRRVVQIPLNILTRPG